MTKANNSSHNQDWAFVVLGITEKEWTEKGNGVQKQQEKEPGTMQSE